MGMVMILASLVNGIHCFVYFIHINLFIPIYNTHTYQYLTQYIDKLVLTFCFEVVISLDVSQLLR